jgi:ribosome-associated translation inhibitor RaiA
MQVPLKITFCNCEPSQELKSEIETEAHRLDAFCNRITGCSITVTAPNLLHHRHGGLFKIDIHVAFPGHKDVVVSTSRSDVHQHEHMSAAIQDAFAAAEAEMERRECANQERRP